MFGWEPSKTPTHRRVKPVRVDEIARLHLTALIGRACTMLEYQEADILTRFHFSRNQSPTLLLEISAARNSVTVEQTDATFVGFMQTSIYVTAGSLFGPQAR